jgi:hypothetical protein
VSIRKILVVAAAGVLALAAPARAQSGPSSPWSLTIGGPSPSGSRFNGWTREFATGASLSVSARFYNAGTSDVSIGFADPTDEVDFWVADASGNYVAYFAASTGSGASTETVKAGASLELDASWDETDWNGQPLAKGIYSVEAYLGDAAGTAIDPVYFTIDHVDAALGAFAPTVRVSPATAQPGAPVQATLHVANLTGDAQVLHFTGPFLPEKVSVVVMDPSGTEIWHWRAMIPMIFTGPANDYLPGLGSIDYGPVTWPGTDDQGAAVPAGTYTLMFRFGGQPAWKPRSAQVTIAAAPAAVSGTITGATEVNVRARGSLSAPVLGQIAGGSPVSVLAQGRSWDKVAGTDVNGNPITGYVRKTYVHVP